MDWRLSRDRLASGTRFLWRGSGIIFVYSENPGHKESKWRLEDTHPGVSPQSGIITQAEVANPRGVPHHGEIPELSVLLKRGGPRKLSGKLMGSPFKVRGGGGIKLTLINISVGNVIHGLTFTVSIIDSFALYLVF